MFLSACTDEISQDLARALEVLAEEGIAHLDLRTLWGKSVVDLSDEEARRARSLIENRGLQVTALSTPVGKSPVTADFAPELARFRRAIDLAGELGAPYLRVFSFMAPEEGAARYRPEALDRLGQLCELAGRAGLTLAHENEEGGFCAWRPEDCVAFHRALPENFQALFEPCSFAVMEIDPLPALAMLDPYLAYVHVRDTRRGTTEYSVVGEGDVGWDALLATLNERGFDGAMTLEPHLGWGKSDYPDPAREADFRRAAAALRSALTRLP